MRHFWTAAAVALTLMGGPAFGQDRGPRDREATDEATRHLESTMTVIAENADLPEAVTKTLELPKDDTGAYLAAQQGVEHSAAGLAKANLAREDGRSFGQATAEAARENAEHGTDADVRDTAEQAREDGRAFAEATAAAAQQNREDLGHGSPPDLGDLLPGRTLPTVPDHPEPPVSPGRP